MKTGNPSDTLRLGTVISLIGLNDMKKLGKMLLAWLIAVGVIGGIAGLIFGLVLVFGGVNAVLVVYFIFITVVWGVFIYDNYFN